MALPWLVFLQVYSLAMDPRKVKYLSFLSSYSENQCSVDSTRRHLWLLQKIELCVPGRKCSMFKHKMAVYTALLQGPRTCERSELKGWVGVEGSADWNWNLFEFYVKTEHHKYFEFFWGNNSYLIVYSQRIPSLQVPEVYHSTHPYISQSWYMTLSPTCLALHKSDLSPYVRRSRVTFSEPQTPQLAVSWHSGDQE